MEEPRDASGTRRLRPWAVGLPLGLIVVLELLRDLVLRPRWGAQRAADTVTVLALVGLAVFSLIIWRLVERAERDLAGAYETARIKERQLMALHEAALSVTGALDLETVLRRVVEASRGVIGSRYGAVAVLAPDGTIGQFVTSGVDAATRRLLGAAPVGHGLLGLVSEEGRPLRVDDITAHPRSVGFPPHHPPMTTLLAVPLRFQGEIFGSLYLADRVDGRPFTPSDQVMLERFGAQASIAVANARLYGEVQRLSLLEERERISMDLHDGVLQNLYATGLGLEAALEELERDPEATRRGVDCAIESLHGTIADIRHYIFDLRTAGTESKLPVVLRQLLDAMAHPGVAVALDVVGEVPELDPQVQWETWHVAREAMANALRHGHPQSVAVHLAVTGAALSLEVRDDGRGFDAQAEQHEQHHGLRNMRRRAEVVGGTLRIDSAPGQGTVVSLTVPMKGGEASSDHSLAGG